ncbi:two-component system, LuxR family, sensor kinase FixL [Paraburkholderia fungorum]|uniref:histidine kinase n=1 Tax=Paraburkholderia fungorum TaxID=134537 RepID=A0A1H1I6L9_9BURK|nr:ATP-binding protein [Paraburkholderia fungorum]SDR33367.1 two-component system, LuxR family, sensor kinase FixL [Paraburkholderia fungorum]
MSRTYVFAESRLKWLANVGACAAWLRGSSRRARQALDSKMPFRQALEMMPVAVVMTDQNTRILFANAKAIKLFGYSREELTAASTEMLFPIHAVCDSHLTGGDNNVENRMEETATTQILVARRRDGIDFPTEVNTTRHGRLNHIVKIVVVLDRSACAEVDRSSENLEHLARVSSLGELAGSLAHELKQPLTAMLFNAQAAQKFMESKTDNAAELHDALEDIVTDNCRASEVIHKIRTFARKGDIDFRLLDVGEVIRDTAKLVHSDAITRGIQTRFDIADNLALVYGDKVQLQQVVLNLLLNAFDAVRQSAPERLRVETIVREEPGGGVRITVKDWGQGLTDDKMHKIFRAFYTTKPLGLGLGLSISRTIITGHGGRLWAENNEGVGASFHLTLPAAPGAQQDSRSRPQ